VLDLSTLTPTGMSGLGTNASAASKMIAIGAIDLGMCVVGEDEPQGKANRCQENAGGNSDYDPRKVPLVAIAGSVRRFVVVHTESIPPVAALRLPPNDAPMDCQERIVNAVALRTPPERRSA
jgi:hypothetical protein